MSGTTRSQLSFNMSEEPGHAGLPAPETIDISDGEILFYRQLFSPAESITYYLELLTNADWKHEKIKYFDKIMDLPRQTAWYGDVGKSYRYSGIKVDPDPWTPILSAIKQRIEVVSGAPFNSVLLNLYRDGRDSVAWHSDDEPELGPNPIIGSVSFGETRSFWFRHKQDSARRFKIDLPSGSYLLMKGPTQHRWLHQIPKTSRACTPRINLTFRVIKEITDVRADPQRAVRRIRPQDRKETD